MLNFVLGFLSGMGIGIVILAACCVATEKDKDYKGE